MPLDTDVRSSADSPCPTSRSTSGATASSSASRRRICGRCTSGTVFITAAARVGSIAPSTSATVCGCSRDRIMASASGSAWRHRAQHLVDQRARATPSKARRAISGPSTCSTISRSSAVAGLGVAADLVQRRRRSGSAPRDGVGVLADLACAPAAMRRTTGSSRCWKIARRQIGAQAQQQRGGALRARAGLAFTLFRRAALLRHAASPLRCRRLSRRATMWAARCGSVERQLARAVAHLHRGIDAGQRLLSRDDGRAAAPRAPSPPPARPPSSRA